MDFWKKWKEDQEAAKKAKEEKEALENISPKDILERLDAEKKAREASESKIDTLVKGLESINAFANEYKSDKEKAAAAAAEAAEAAKKKAQKTPEQQAEEAEALATSLIDDPAGTVDRLTKGTQAAVLELKADSIRKEVFEDAQEYPYYSGDVKAEVDKILAAQSLQFRCQPESVKNVYYTVVGKKQKEISEGKVKSRFASSSQSLNSGVGDSKNEIKLEITPEVIKAAKISGMKPEEYVKLLEQEVKDGNISYV